MDEFGVFTESFGLKPQGKSAPMAASKRPTTTTITTDNAKPVQNSISGNGSFLDVDFGIFLPSSSNNPKKTTTQNFGNSGGYGDVFGELTKNYSMQSNGSSSFDYDPFYNNLNDSVSKTSSMPGLKNFVYRDDDDIFGGMPGLKTWSSSVDSNNNNDDVFAPFTSAAAPKQSASGGSIDDLLGNIGGSKSRSKGFGRKESGETRKNSNGFDVLIPGFGGRSIHSNNERQGWESSSMDEGSSSSTHSDDERQGWEFLSRAEFNQFRREFEQFRLENRQSLRNLQQALDDVIVGLNALEPNKNINDGRRRYDDCICIQSIRNRHSEENHNNKEACGNDHDVFAPFTAAPKQSGYSFDDFLKSLGGSESISKGLGKKESGEILKFSNGFDDLIPGFGSKSPLVDGKKVETFSSHQSTTVHSTNSTSTLLEEPFIVIESTSTPVNASSGVFSDPLEELSKLDNAGRTKVSPSNGVVYDNTDLLDGFASSVPTNGSQKIDKPSMSEETLKTADDARIHIPKIPPFKQPNNGSPPLRPPPVKPSQVSKADKAKSSVVSSIDELEDFAMGRVRNNFAASATLKDATERFEVKFKQARELRERKAKASMDTETPEAEKNNKKNSEDDLASFSSASSRSRSVPRSRASTTDSMLNTQLRNGGGPKVGQRTSSGTSSRINKAPPVINIVDDLSSIFVGGQFDEVEGESEERRRARLGRHCRTNDRMAQAVADMNQRDLQILREQEERHKISQTLDGEIKHWAAGKEGNLRALLSSLQSVLWSDSGWQPVSLTDIITPASVKKVYRKATLCIHPDKVQQKGANLEQKYIAEKVFDILKEAWNKFDKEELS